MLSVETHLPQSCNLLNMNGTTHDLLGQLLHQVAMPVSSEHMPKRLKTTQLCETFEESRDALRLCDRVCNLLMLQEHDLVVGMTLDEEERPAKKRAMSVNAACLGAAVLTHTFTQIVPVPLGINRANNERCVWAAVELDYAKQCDMLMLLQRLQAHVARVASTAQSMPTMDIVRLVLPGCIAAIADCVMRCQAVDSPSEVCSNVARYGVRTGALDCLIHTLGNRSTFSEPARRVAVAVHDYFASFQELNPIFEWEQGNKFTNLSGTKFLLADICAEVGFPGEPLEYLCDGLLTMNYPELRCYRDIVFWFKFLLNSSPQQLMSFSVDPSDRRDATLNWKVARTREEPSFEVFSFGNVRLWEHAESCDMCPNDDVLLKSATQSGCPTDTSQEGVLHITALLRSLPRHDCDTLLSYFSSSLHDDTQRNKRPRS